MERLYDYRWFGCPTGSFQPRSWKYPRKVSAIIAHERVGHPISARVGYGRREIRIIGHHGTRNVLHERGTMHVRRWLFDTNRFRRIGFIRNPLRIVILLHEQMVSFTILRSITLKTTNGLRRSKRCQRTLPRNIPFLPNCIAL